MIPQKEKLEEIVLKLQEIMRIQDWDIKLKLLTAQEMHKETGSHENMGEAYRNVRYKYAEIRLNTQDSDNGKDWYHTIIHEMKHIQTTEFIYTFHKLFKCAEMPESLKKAFKEQTEDYYEQWMNVCAREFEKLYPASNFFKEGEPHV